jgi:hypothetical protein
MAENKKTTAARTTDRPSTETLNERNHEPPPPLHRQHQWHPFPSLAPPNKKTRRRIHHPQPPTKLENEDEQPTILLENHAHVRPVRYV